MKGKIITTVIITAIIFGVGGFLISKALTPKEKCVDVDITHNDTKDDEPIKKEDNDNTDKKDLVNHTFTRTYNIKHIDESHDYVYLYITIREFQAEEIETVRVKRSLFDTAKVGENYEITFKITNNNSEDDLKSIFDNSEVIKAVKTDKEGREQVCDSSE